MKRKDEDESRQKLTNDIGEYQKILSQTKTMLPAEFDPRVVEIVRFLARTAAEKDYAALIARTRREPEGEKEIL